MVRSIYDYDAESGERCGVEAIARNSEREKEEEREGMKDTCRYLFYIQPTTPEVWELNLERWRKQNSTGRSAEN